MLHTVSIIASRHVASKVVIIVGHCHPYVVKQIYKQMGACATNNRYLHDNTVILAERLTKTLPAGLEQVFYTNSA